MRGLGARGRRARVLGTGASPPYLPWLSIPSLELVPLLSSGRYSLNGDPRLDVAGWCGGGGGLQSQVELGSARVPSQAAAEAGRLPL